jgi:hypothetical protein
MFCLFKIKQGKQKILINPCGILSFSAVPLFQFLLALEENTGEFGGFSGFPGYVSTKICCRPTESFCIGGETEK